MNELNFNDTVNINEEMLIDSLTYSNMVYNVEECGMTWEGLATLFGEDSTQAAQAHYEQSREEY